MLTASFSAESRTPTDDLYFEVARQMQTNDWIGWTSLERTLRRLLAWYKQPFSDEMGGAMTVKSTFAVS